MTVDSVAIFLAFGIFPIVTAQLLLTISSLKKERAKTKSREKLLAYIRRHADEPIN